MAPPADSQLGVSEDDADAGSGQKAECRRLDVLLDALLPELRPAARECIRQQHVDGQRERVAVWDEPTSRRIAINGGLRNHLGPQERSKYLMESVLYVGKI